MPESAFDETLERMLAYPEEPAATDADRFVVEVMGRLRRERRRRRLILFTFGGIGALFGVAGAALLNEPLGRLLSDTLSATAWMQGALFAAGAAAFYLWVMNDDLAPER